ncbi:MAG: hypothetical protein WC969_01570 [Elusimicrobiota bacterium]|jgi:hypothetical protein
MKQKRHRRRAPSSLAAPTQREVAAAFRSLDSRAMGPVYCDEGGAAFWRALRAPCRRMSERLAAALRARLRPGGRSLYAGAGVAEIAPLAMEALELEREVEPFNLRRAEVRFLARACRSLPFSFRAEDARRARGRFDHLWLVSVLNDPEQVPELSALSYGRANPVLFSPGRFAAERRETRALADALLRKLFLPALVTTSVEELVWVAEWCEKRRVPFRVEDEEYPTALVGDPVRFVRLG